VICKIIKALYYGSLVSIVFIVLTTGCSVNGPKGQVTKQMVIKKKKAMDLFIEGKVAEEKENFAGAITSYMEALQYDPKSEDITRDLADAAGILAAKGMTDDAVSIFMLMVERDPLDVDAWISLGEFYIGNERFNDARNTFTKGLEKNPDNTLLLIGKGNSCLQLYDWDCAIANYEKADSLGLKNAKILKTLCALYFYAGRDSDGNNMLDSLKSMGDDDASLYFSLGKSMNFLGHYDEAVNYFRKGFDKDVDKLKEGYLREKYAMYVNALTKLDRYDEALTLVQGEMEKHIKDLNKIKRLEASIYVDMERFDDAIAIYEWLMASDPQNIDYYFGLGQIYMMAEEYKKAEQTLLKVRKIDSKNIGYLMQLSMLYDTTGEFKKAEEALLKVLKLEPENDLALNNLAYMYIENDKNISRAIDMVKRAIEKKPENGAYHDTLGWGYYKKDQYKKAKKHIENALVWEEINGKGIIYEHYGDILVKLKMKKEAIEAYRKAIESGEDKSKIQPKLDKLQ